MGWGDYESPTVRALRSIDSSKYNKEFVQNMQSLNYATDFMADYMIVMQQGIDDANKDIIQKIQDFIEDLIIIFGGGEYGDSGFEWGDLGYIIQALGALFGFQGIDGPINLIESAVHFLTNFLFGSSEWDEAIENPVVFALHALADLLDMVPFVGETLSEIVENLADGLNSTNSTANTAQSTATTAQSTANTANTNANTALSTANTANTNASAAQTAASNAATVAAAAQATADIAYDYGTYREKEFAVTTSGLLNGNNETVLGIILPVPPDSIIKITRLIYSMKQNNGTFTVQLIRKVLAGTESIVHSTNIPNSVITHSDNTIDYQITDMDHYFCNITSLAATVVALHCCVEYVILPVP